MPGLGLGVGLRQPARRAVGGPVVNQASLDFIDSLPVALTYSGNTGTGTSSTFRGSLTMPATGARRTERGLLIEPAATNLATNPRNVGAVGVVFGAAVRTQVLAASSIATTAGSKIVTVTDTGHGRSVGDRVTFQNNVAVGGITLESTFAATYLDALAYAIVEVVDANTYRIRHGRAAATSTASGGGTPTARYWSVAADTMPTGHGRNITGNLSARIIDAVNNAFQNTPVTLGARRRFEVVGTGEVILDYGIEAGFAQGETVTLAQVFAYEGWPNLDFTTLENVTTFSWELQELSAADAVLATQTYNILTASPSPICDDARLVSFTATLGNASTAKIRWRVRLAMTAGHVRLATFEHSITKTSWVPSIALPAPGATGSVTRPASDASMPLPFPMATQGTIHFDFDAPEIVSSRDCILSIGSLRFTALGTSFPRNLEMTDGTNTIVATGAITKTMYTEDTRKVVASWGPSGMVLSVDGAAAVTTGSYSSAGFGSTVWLGRTSGGTERSVLWVKQLEFRDDTKTAAQAAARSHLLWAVPIAMPGRDFPVGRTSVAPLKVPGIDPLPSGVTRSGQRLIPAATNIVFEDWDLRGFFIQASGTPNQTNGLIIRQCLFDDVAAGTFSTVQIPVCSVPWLVEHNTIPSAGDAGNIGLTTTLQVLINAGKPLIRRNLFNGFVRDCVNGYEADIIENHFIATITQLGAHSDAIQLVGNSAVPLPFAVRGNLIDIRNRFGNRASANYTIYLVDAQTAITEIATSENNVLLGGSYTDSYVKQPGGMRGFARCDVLNNWYQRGYFASTDNQKYTFPSAQTQFYPDIINYTGNRDLHRPAKTLVLA